MGLRETLKLLKKQSNEMTPKDMPLYPYIRKVHFSALIGEAVSCSRREQTKKLSASVIHLLWNNLFVYCEDVFLLWDFLICLIKELTGS